MLYLWQVRQTAGRFVDFDDLPSRRFDFVVNINQADWPELANLPGIGEKLAKQIVQYRADHGPFRSIDQLLELNGIGEKKLAAISPYVQELNTSRTAR
jgi:competence protein ComEA